MAIIPQTELFSWEQIEPECDLKRLELVVESMPDEDLMRRLESERGNGRDDYPVRAMMNSLYAGIVYEHASIASLRRELLRNGQLRRLCGFKLTLGDEAVPSASAFSRFLAKLMEHQDMLDAIFDKLVEVLRTVLPDFGRVLAIDGKAIETHANPRKDGDPDAPDGRRDLDATYGCKTVSNEGDDFGEEGNAYKKIISWFGYKLDLIVDAQYELPVAYEVSKANEHDAPAGENLVDEMAQSQPWLVERCEAIVGDKAYDSEHLLAKWWDDYNIAGIVPMREMWKDGEETRLIDGTRNVVYDSEGNVYCCCMTTGEFIKMANGGFEKDRMCQKYLCPAKHYGTDCPDKSDCPVGKSIRIKLDINRRVFAPIARDSYKFQRYYDKRNSVERVNSRLDVSFGFERHFIRGQKKMKLRCGLALMVMLAIAYGHISEKQPERMRSLVSAA